MAKPIPTDIPDDVKARFWARIDVRGPNECWPWKGSGAREGYGSFSMFGQSYRAHRLSLVLARGKDLRTDQQACHRCDNPPCCNPAHLFVGTNYDNIQDRTRKGRTVRAPRDEVKVNHQRGEKHHKAKLNRALVEEIRERVSRGETIASLARNLGMNSGHLSRVVSGRNWK